LIAPFEAVLVPALSRMLPQPERYRRVVLQVYEVVAVTSFLFTGVLLALARPLTLVVLGPKWDKAAAIFAGFTMVALYVPVASVGSWLIASQGRGEDFLRLSSISAFAVIASFFAGLPFGPVGVAIAYSTTCLLIFLPLVYYLAGRCGPVRTRDLWIRFLTHLPLWCVVCGATWLMRILVVDTAPVTQLLICAPFGLLVGAGFIFIYGPARRAAFYLIETLREWARTRGRIG
jgi:PST family polysaccharide transporter